MSDHTIICLICECATPIEYTYDGICIYCQEEGPND